MEVNIGSLPWERTTVSFESVSLIIETRYNSRNDNWYLDVFNILGEPILRGIQFAIDTDLTDIYRTELRGLGSFYVLDKRIDMPYEKITRDNVGLTERYGLFFYPSE